MKRLILVLCIMLFLPCIALAGKGGGNTQPSAPWPMFGNNPQHTGQSSYAGPSAGTIKWEVPTGMFNNYKAGNIAIGQDGTLYVTGDVYNPETMVHDGVLAAYNPSDGTLKWQTVMITNGAANTAPAIGSAGVIYAEGYSNSSSTRYLYALNQSGQLQWQTFLGGTPPYTSIITVGKDGTIYVPGSELTAVNPDGTIKWVYYCPAKCSSVAISPAGDAIYTVMISYTTLSPRLLALNTNAGYLWDFSIGNSGHFVQVDQVNPIAVDGDGTIYLEGIWDNTPYLHAVTPSGIEKWSYLIDRTTAGELLNPTVSKRGNIYFMIPGSDFSTSDIYALDSRGRFKWKYTINASCTNNSPAIDPNENIYFAGDNGVVYSLTSGGVLRWSVAPSSAQYFWGHSPSLGKDGRLYITNDNMNLYSIGK